VFCDSLIYDSTSRMLKASGHVRFVNELGGSVEADTMTLKIDGDRMVREP
jgi:hypothetical protein